MRRLILFPRHQRDAARLLEATEQDEMERHIANDRERHPLISGGSGMRKARWARPGRGKSGGVRVIYYFAARTQCTSSPYMRRTKRRISVMPKKRSLRKSSGRSSDKSTRLGRILVESAKEIARHMRGEIELPTKVVRVVPDVDVRAIRQAQGLTREQFAERYGLQVRAIQEWEQGRRKPEPAVRAYMLVIKNQPAAVRKALTAA
jgi:putative transcriptional regulator